MTYNPNIPQPGDDPTISQAQILSNYGILNTDFNVNHIPFTQSANPGLHTQINFPVPLTLDPNLSSPQSSLYPKNQLQTASNELFFQNNNTFPFVSQLTNLPIVNGVITGVTPGSPNTITTANTLGLINDDTVTFYNILGSTQLNGNTYTVSNVTANTFTVIQAGVSAYIGGGYYITNDTFFYSSTIYGFKSPWGIIFNMGFTGDFIPGATIFFAYPFATNFIIYFAGATAPTGNPAISNITATSFTWSGTTSLSTYFLVIGK